MAILCVHLGVGPDSPPSTFLRLSSHIGDLSVSVILFPFSSQHSVQRLTPLEGTRKKDKRGMVDFTKLDTSPL